MMEIHEHKLVLIRSISNHHIRWCRICGLVMEDFGGRFCEMIPAWSKSRLSACNKTKYTYVSDKSYKKVNKLGRGLKNIDAPKSDSLQKLLENTNAPHNRKKEEQD